MKRFLILTCLTVIACCGLASCGEEQETFGKIDFTTTGVHLSSQGAIYYQGKVDASGGEIIITAMGKNASNGFLSQIRVGDYLYEVTDTDREEALPRTLVDEAWGKVEILSVSPHTTRIVLNEN